jgi:hypothetical protein
MEVVVAYLRHLPTMTSEGSEKLRQTKKREAVFGKMVTTFCVPYDLRIYKADYSAKISHKDWTL